MRLIILYCILFRKDFIEDSVMEAKTFKESNTVPGIIHNICKKKIGGQNIHDVSTCFLLHL